MTSTLKQFKPCTKCGEVKPLTDFALNSTNKDGRRNDCKECHSNNVRTRRYGITLEEYDKLFAEQQGVCAICGSHCDTGKRLAVDHNHQTGQVRGLLCMMCNTAIGKLRDDPALVRRAAAYLEAYQ